MRWRDRDWPERPPRPKKAKLPRETLERFHTRAVGFVEKSVVLGDLLENVELARGRLYFWRQPKDLMARITPLGPRSMLLEAPYGNSWTEKKRGQFATVLKALEGDTLGTFHGLGSLAKEPRDGKPTAQIVLHREIGIPVRVLAEPGYWSSMHRKPVIVGIGNPKDRVLVRFFAHTFSESFHGTCLNGLREGK